MGKKMVEHKTPKDKRPGKKLNLGQYKKTLMSGGLIAVIAIAGIITGIILITVMMIQNLLLFGGQRV